MITPLLILVMGFSLLGFFAGMEMAFVSRNKLQIRHKAEKGESAARVVDSMQERPQLFLASVLLYQNVSHVMLTSAFAYLLEVTLHVTDPFALTAMLAPFVVIFAEMVPKEYCRQKANALILQCA